MTTVINDSSGPLDLLAIEVFEEKYGVILPHEYRSFLSQYNGGYPEPDCFNFVGSDDGSSVDKFLGLGVGEHSNLDDYTSSYKERIPIDFLPIAHDPGGNLIIIGISGEFQNKIYFWDHEYETESPSLENICFVSESLTEFLENLYDIDF